MSLPRIMARGNSPGAVSSTALLLLTTSLLTACASDRQVQQGQLQCLVRELDASASDRRELAIEGLGQLGVAAAPAVPQLARLLAAPSTDPELRETILATLNQIGAAAAAAVPGLLRAIAAHPDLEPAAKQTLSRIGADGERRVLEALREDTDWRIRRQAARLLVDLTIQQIEESLVASLTGDARGEVREEAARVLGERMVQSARPALASALRDRHWETAAAAAEALARIGGAESMRLLREALASQDPTTSLAVAVALRTLPSSAASEAMPVWLRALSDPRWPVRAAVAQAIGSLRLEREQQAAQAAIAALNRLLTDPAIEVQEAAEDALAGVRE